MLAEKQWSRQCFQLKWYEWIMLPRWSNPLVVFSRFSKRIAETIVFVKEEPCDTTANFLVNQNESLERVSESRTSLFESSERVKVSFSGRTPHFQWTDSCFHHHPAAHSASPHAAECRGIQRYPIPSHIAKSTREPCSYNCPPKTSPLHWSDV